MSRNNLFAIRMLSAVSIGTRRVLAGTAIELDAQTAAALIRAGRGRLVDDADLKPLLDAVGPRHGGAQVDHIAGRLRAPADDR